MLTLRDEHGTRQSARMRGQAKMAKVQWSAQRTLLWLGVVQIYLERDGDLRIAFAGYCFDSNLSYLVCWKVCFLQVLEELLQRPALFERSFDRGVVCASPDLPLGVIHQAGGANVYEFGDFLDELIPGRWLGAGSGFAKVNPERDGLALSPYLDRRPILLVETA